MARFDLEIRAEGDLDVDQHHTVEDLGIALGEAVSKALGTRRGINRAGYFIMPMDEALGVAAIDLGGRPHAVVDLASQSGPRRRSAERADPRLLRRVRARRAGQRAREGALRPLEPSSRRGRVQGVRPCAARRVLAGQTARANAPEHEGTAVIALIDYGAGNLTSVRKALVAVGAEVNIPRVPSELERRAGRDRPRRRQLSAHTSALDRDWRDGIIAAIERGRPLLGICLGLQWLFEGSTEAPDCEGLSLMTGQCDRLEAGRGRSRFRTSDGTRWSSRAPRACSRESETDRRCTSRTPMPRR